MLILSPYYQTVANLLIPWIRSNINNCFEPCFWTPAEFESRIHSPLSTNFCGKYLFLVAKISSMLIIWFLTLTLCRFVQSRKWTGGVICDFWTKRALALLSLLLLRCNATSSSMVPRWPMTRTQAHIPGSWLCDMNISLQCFSPKRSEV